MTAWPKVMKKEDRAETETEGVAWAAYRNGGGCGSVETLVAEGGFSETRRVPLLGLRHHVYLFGLRHHVPLTAASCLLLRETKGEKKWGKDIRTYETQTAKVMQKGSQTRLKH